MQYEIKENLLKWLLNLKNNEYKQFFATLSRICVYFKWDFIAQCLDSLENRRYNDLKCFGDGNYIIDNLLYHVFDKEGMLEMIGEEDSLQLIEEKRFNFDRYIQINGNPSKDMLLQEGFNVDAVEKFFTKIDYIYRLSKQICYLQKRYGFPLGSDCSKSWAP